MLANGQSDHYRDEYNCHGESQGHADHDRHSYYPDFTTRNLASLFRRRIATGQQINRRLSCDHVVQVHSLLVQLSTTHLVCGQRFQRLVSISRENERSVELRVFAIRAWAWPNSRNSEMLKSPHWCL